jgi:hypothetical protein
MVFGSVPDKFLLVLASTIVLGYRPRWTNDHIFLPHWPTSVPGKLLLAFASTVILGSGIGGTCYRIFLSYDSELWDWVLALDWSVGWVNCCWSSPAQLFLFPDPEGLVTIFFCLTTLGAVEAFHLTFGAEQSRAVAWCWQAASTVARGSGPCGDPWPYIYSPLRPLHFIFIEPPLRWEEGLVILSRCPLISLSTTGGYRTHTSTK